MASSGSGSSFFSGFPLTPQYGAGRGLASSVVSRFFGIDVYTSMANTAPDHAIDLMNVMISPAGLEKLRVPTKIDQEAVSQGGVQTCYGIFNFQNPAGLRQLIVVWGNRICKYDVHADGSLGPKVTVSVNDNYAAQWSAVTSSNTMFMANGKVMVKWDGATLSRWGIDPAMQPMSLTLSAGAGGTVRTFTMGGRKYAYTMKNSVTGHQSPLGVVSGVTGNGAFLDGGIVVHLGDVARTDMSAGLLEYLAVNPQVDTIVWWATIDGGSQYYYHSEQAVIPNPLFPDTLASLTDNLQDVDLNTDIQVPLLNYPPPIGKYLALWGGRIYIGNLDGAETDIVYSGYELIQVGRPEESFPQSNRLRLDVGADEIRGIGVLQSGVVAGDKSNKMFMFRGVVEDIVSTQPVAYSETLEELPWGRAMGSHHSIAQTSGGLAYLSSQRTVDLYDGTSEPTPLTLAISPFMTLMTAGMDEDAVGMHFNYNNRNWYMLAMPTAGSPFPDKIVVIDLTPNSGENAGIFMFDVGPVDTFGIWEDPNGHPRICIAQAGNLYELKVLSAARNGMNTDPASTDAILDAWWYPGYMGNETPQMMKTWRKLHVVADQPVGVYVRLVDDRVHKLANPLEIVADESSDRVLDGVMSVNVKAVRMSAGIVFPIEDMDVCVQQYWADFIPTRQR